jgi:hypothetical protein
MPKVKVRAQSAISGAMAVDPELAGSPSVAVVFSQFFWPPELQQLIGLRADGI